MSAAQETGKATPEYAVQILVTVNAYYFGIQQGTVDVILPDGEVDSFYYDKSDKLLFTGWVAADKKQEIEIVFRKRGLVERYPSGDSALGGGHEYMSLTIPLADFRIPDKEATREKPYLRKFSDRRYLALDTITFQNGCFRKEVGKPLAETEDCSVLVMSDELHDINSRQFDNWDLFTVFPAQPAVGDTVDFIIRAEHVPCYVEVDYRIVPTGGDRYRLEFFIGYPEDRVYCTAIMTFRVNRRIVFTAPGTYHITIRESRPGYYSHAHTYQDIVFKDIVVRGR